MIEPRLRVPTMLRDRILMSREDRTRDTRSGPAPTFWARKLAEAIHKALRNIGEFRLRRGHPDILDPWRE
jgi:hypothetical protein